MADDTIMMPLAGWHSMTLSDDACAIRLELVPNEQALETGHRVSIVVSMTRKQAQQLVPVLQQMADAPHIPRAKGSA